MFETGSELWEASSWMTTDYVLYCNLCIYYQCKGVPLLYTSARQIKSPDTPEHGPHCRPPIKIQLKCPMFLPFCLQKKVTNFCIHDIAVQIKNTYIVRNKKIYLYSPLSRKEKLAICIK